MIGQITGTVVHKEANVLIVTTGGVGYTVRVLREIAHTTPLQRELTLWTHLAVREDSMELYGFKDRDELQLFEQLVGVSGIGPKSAISILNLAPVSKLTHAISSEDSSYLTKVSGIGKKSAAKIILELKDVVVDSQDRHDEGGLREEKDALAALVSLGYSTGEARGVLQKIDTSRKTVNEKIKAALKLLSSQE